MKNHPHLAELYTIYKSESQPFRKVHRMIDLFESIIKTHTVVILGEYFKQNKYSNAAKGLLATGLRTPSLGTWQLFSRVLYKELAAENHVFFQVDFAKEFEKLDKDLDNQKTNVISFRNEYAHGATPSDELCSEDIKRFEPFLESLLASKWLANSTLLELEGKVSISNSSTAVVISLYPILLFKPEPNAQPFVFFNDLKNDKVGLLNYPLSKHYREKDFFQEFNTYLPLKEWKNSGSSEFHQRIEELTETFKGRIQERLRIREFIEKKDKGYFSIQGNPGIGKSALIAQLFKDLTNHTPKLPIKLVEYFIRRGTAQANSTYLLNYLLKATDTHFSEGKNIQAEGKTNWDLQQQLFAKWRAYGDANPKEKLVFFIDGLDEGVENDILRYLPRENFKDIIVIYGSRPGGHKDIEAFWTELPVEYHQSLLLTGLSKNDIRALLYEVGNKYEIEKDSAWIDTVEKRSEGNPLYLKLLCNAIENGSIPYNDPKALPTEINDYYKAILTRYANDSQDGDALLSSLFVFAAAVDYLTPVHLQLINGFGTAQSIRIESTLKEVLYENPLTEEVLDYQLFHESFREFLVQFYPTELKRAETKLLEFCSTWNTLQHTFEQRYALQYYTSHLTQNSSKQCILTLINLSKNKAYTDTQKKVLRGFNATKQLYQEIVHHTIKSASTDEALEAALALVELKYEEQNDVVSILTMVANNEIDLALQRIAALGGESKEDKQRQFILYMLCLMELTLLESKTQPWRKSAIEKLLAQFEEQIPIDHSLVNWDDFFSSFLMFLISVELAILDVDFLELYKRTKVLDMKWIDGNGPYSNFQYNLFKVIANNFYNGKIGFNEESRTQYITLCSIPSEMAKEGKVEQAIEFLKNIEISNNIFISQTNKTQHYISIELAKQGKNVVAIDFARTINDEVKKIDTVSKISTIVFEQGMNELSSTIMQESIDYANCISDDFKKNSAYHYITIELAKQGKVDSLDYAKIISDDYLKSRTYALISSEFSNQGMIKDSEILMNQAIEIAQNISDEMDKINAIRNIVIELEKQDKKDYALLLIKQLLGFSREIKNEIQKIRSLISIYKETNKLGMFELASDILDEAINCVRGYSRDRIKIDILTTIYKEVYTQGNIEIANDIIKEAFSCAIQINLKFQKNKALKSIISEIVMNGGYKKASLYMLTELNSVSGNLDKINTLKIVSVNLSNQGKEEEAIIGLIKSLNYIDEIKIIEHKYKAFLSVANGLNNKGKEDIVESLMQKSLECSELINIRIGRSVALKNISIEFSKQGKFIDAIECTRKISSERHKNIALKHISIEFINAEKIEEAQECIRNISDELEKVNTLAILSTKLFSLGMKDDASLIIVDAITFARDMNSDDIKSEALANISTELYRQEKSGEAALIFQEAKKYFYNINFEEDKISTLKKLFFELINQERKNEGIYLIDEIFELNRIISNESYKNNVFVFISTEKAKLSKIHEAESVALQISATAVRHYCWKEIAKVTIEIHDALTSLDFYSEFKNEEARTFYLKGWAEHVGIQSISNEVFCEALPLLAQDTEALEQFLQTYAIQVLFFENPSQAKIQMLNQTLNLQWALDIQSQLPQPQTATRLSTNLDTWLHEINDEDDQDQITLWAKQVVKGKITDEEFQNRIKDI